MLNFWVRKRTVMCVLLVSDTQILPDIANPVESDRAYSRRCSRGRGRGRSWRGLVLHPFGPHAQLQLGLEVFSSTENRNPFLGRRAKRVQGGDAAVRAHLPRGGPFGSDFLKVRKRRGSSGLRQARVLDRVAGLLSLQNRQCRDRDGGQAVEMECDDVGASC